MKRLSMWKGSLEINSRGECVAVDYPFHQVLTELESYHELRVMIDTLGSFDSIKMSTRGVGGFE
jgi:hypothetical protein